MQEETVWICNASCFNQFNRFATARNGFTKRMFFLAAAKSIHILWEYWNKIFVVWRRLCFIYRRYLCFILLKFAVFICWHLISSRFWQVTIQPLKCSLSHNRNSLANWNANTLNRTFWNSYPLWVIGIVTQTKINIHISKNSSSPPYKAKQNFLER